MKKISLMLITLLVLASLAVGMLACSAPQETVDIYIPGTYTGTSRGMGPITVTVTVDSLTITAVEITGPGETQGVGGWEAIQDGSFANRILEAQSAQIDAISGATLTSTGIAEATDDALGQARSQGE
ncbi:MAG: FMN-binding protein [Coriobacteriales bacterium]|nr:FMN-binding protein [Coriobacteriales bacterium]